MVVLWFLTTRDVWVCIRRNFAGKLVLNSLVKMLLGLVFLYLILFPSFFDAGFGNFAVF